MRIVIGGALAKYTTLFIILSGRDSTLKLIGFFYSKYMNSYELSRKWFDWSFENPEKISPNHSALYFFAIEHCNRLGWRQKFGFPTEMAKDAVGIKSYNTYVKTLNDLVEWGFIIMIERSKNQYSSNIIALSNFDKALDKALDKAIVKANEKQRESTCESIDSIDKPLTKEHNTNLSVDWDILRDNFNQLTGKKTLVISEKAKRQIKARLKEGYSKQDLWNAIVNCFNDPYHKENPRYLTLEFISRSDKMEKYCTDIKKQKNKEDKL